ncbi:MAG: flagellar biosynthesis protein FlhB [Oscillospiraceae bacterium]|jgi:flagellar biosynthetic protein FlhB|nr:flagellar biosynthesis protein FlhB [Oscillospiraceae bacterium]
MTTSQGEKTEKATPKKRQDARKKGQVLKSAEVNTAVMTMAMFATLYLFGSAMSQSLMGMMTAALTGESAQPPTVHGAYTVITSSLWRILLMLAPFFAVAIVMGLAVNVAQIGFLLVGEPLRPKLSKISILQGFKRIFSLKSVAEMLKAVLKITLVAWVVYDEYTKSLGGFAGMMGLTVPQSAAHIFTLVVNVAFRAILVLAAIGLADYLYQWWEYERNLRMTKEEVRQEYKLQEGDPQIKAKRREKQRRMSMLRMMQALPRADVVITNPTHYAVALRWREEEAPAPVVVAKGKDYVAQKIKEKARELKIEIVENKAVAQALYLACDIDDEIPEDMFMAVAEILAGIYRLRNPKTA